MSLCKKNHSQDFFTVKIDRAFDYDEDEQAFVNNDNSTPDSARQKDVQSEREHGQVRNIGDDAHSAELMRQIPSSAHLASSIFSETGSSQAQSFQQGDQVIYNGKQGSNDVTMFSSISGPLIPKGHVTKGGKNKSVRRWYFMPVASMHSAGENINDTGDSGCSNDRDKDEEEGSEKEDEWENELDDERESERESESESDKEHKPLMPLTLECFILRDGNDRQQPAVVKASTRFAKWTFDMAEYEDGLSNVVFSMSTANLALLRLDSIAFCIESEPGSPESVEIITHARLQKLFSPELGIFKWKMHLQLVKKRETHTVSITMEIRTRGIISSETDLKSLDHDTGYLELYWMELHPAQYGGRLDDPSLRAHKPYVWSIDVNDRSDHVPTVDQRIVVYSVSGDGTHVATLSAMPTDIVLDLWIIPGDSDCLTSSNLRHCATTSVKAASRDDPCLRNSFALSVSWDASQIALTDGTKEGNRIVAAYRYKRDHSLVAPESASRDAPRELLNDHKHPPYRTKDFVHGSFHMTGTKDPDPRDELFVVLKSTAVEVYRVWLQWEHVYTILYEQPFRQPPDLLKSSRRLILLERDIYFALSFPTMSGLNIDKRSRLWSVNYFSDDTIALSSDSLRVAAVGPWSIAVLCAVTGATIQTRHLPRWYSEVLGVSFIRDNTQIMIETNGTNDDIGLSRSGLIVDAEDLSIITYFACQEECRIQHLPEARQTQYAYTSHGSVMDMINLDDCLRQPFLEPRLFCDDQCKTAWLDPNMCLKKFTSPAGLQFEYDGHLEKWLPYKAAIFLPAQLQLVVTSDDWTMMWQLPAGEDDEFNLLVLDEYFYLHICAHQQLYHRGRDYNATLFCADHKLTLERYGRSFPVMHVALHMLYIAEGACRKARIRFASAFFNKRRTVHENGPASGIVALCEDWWMCDTDSDSDSAVIKAVKIGLSSFLGPECSRWVPLPEDECLPLMTKRKNLPSVFMLDTLRRLAYIPANNRDYTIRHGSIAHPPEFRWKFWTPLRREPHGCKDPVLRIRKIPGGARLTSELVPLLFAASFDMIWSNLAKPEAPSARKRWPGTLPQASQSFIRDMLYMIWHKTWVNGPRAISQHYISIEALDNPAIYALVEYKWNTYVFWYWLMRFLSQCIFYVLVITVVFLQVYHNHQENYTGVLITIIAMSTVFLWIEVIQIFRQDEHYFASKYNIIDWLAFGLPLVASIHQLVTARGDSTEERANSGLFSFSVLFIFLHCLFELRVNYSLCYFVTIMVQIISRIPLINQGFGMGDETWKVVWLRNRLWYVAAAEEMTYYIPGKYLRFRLAHDWFPKEIYYTATSQEINAYEKKYFNGGDEFKDCHGSAATKFVAFKLNRVASLLPAVPLNRSEPEGSIPVPSLSAAKRKQDASDQIQEQPHMAGEDETTEEPQHQKTTMLLRSLKKEMKQDLRDTLKQSQDQIQNLQDRLSSQQERSQSRLTKQHELQMQSLTARLEELQNQIGEQQQSMDNNLERMLEQIIALLAVKPADA
ncbi:hypothetical protein BGZ47_005509 [Haplosporangium gracile]|nr:hypothetical protein BGZ47_005509 [Haplosporangium gracile]